ncbi:MAG: hypothetical protein NTX59_11480 [Elusimicrobia bacterium]|nr:hypothetical protein [Elusimicrobiota bacterium]
MQEGKWLDPRYTDKEIFEKDYPKLDLSGMDVKCPGCKNQVTLNRKNNSLKAAGWCKQCNRAVHI